MSLTRVTLFCVTSMMVACGGGAFGSSETADDSQTSAQATAPTNVLGGDSSNPADGTSTIDAPSSQLADSVTITADQLADSGRNDSSNISEEHADAQAPGDAVDAGDARADAQGGETQPEVGGPDGSVDAPIDTAMCDASLVLYRDQDHDGYGTPEQQMKACPLALDPDAATGWVSVAGDCRDDLPGVHPGAPGSGVGHPDPSKPQQLSFDMNCDGSETADPSNTYGTEPSCPATLLNCTGTGYVPVTPVRSGVNINPYCGSHVVKSCVVNGLNCVAQLITVSAAYRCQ